MMNYYENAECVAAATVHNVMIACWKKYRDEAGKEIPESKRTTFIVITVRREDTAFSVEQAARIGAVLVALAAVK